MRKGKDGKFKQLEVPEKTMHAKTKKVKSCCDVGKDGARILSPPEVPEKKVHAKAKRELRTSVRHGRSLDCVYRQEKIRRLGR
jgi:hypothetical protein